MTDITFDQLVWLLAFILAAIGVYNTVMTALKNRREEIKQRNSPITQLRERVDRHDELLEKDNVRLNAHDKQLSVMGQESKIMLRGVRALLSHEINGNSVEKLKDSMTEIDDYLISRK